MTKKYFDGTVVKNEITEELDRELYTFADDTLKKYHKAMNSYHNADACAAIMDLAKRCNKYIDETMPWALAKDETQKTRLNDVLYNLLDCIKLIGTLLRPITPDTAKAIAGDNIDTAFRTADSYTPGDSAVMFPRLDTDKVLAEIAAEQETKEKANEKAEDNVVTVEQIGIEDFAKVELTTAKITACEPIPKAKKLLKLTLNDGSNTPRTVASGIAKYYTPDELIGKTVIVVSNLKPATLCGVESNGMILAADCADGDVKVIFVDGIPEGCKIR